MKPRPPRQPVLKPKLRTLRFRVAWNFEDSDFVHLDMTAAAQAAAQEMAKIIDQDILNGLRK